MKNQYYTTSSYNNNRSYPMPSNNIINKCQSSVGIFDEYLLYCTGDNEFNLYVNRPISNDYRIQFTTSNGYIHSTKYEDFDGKWDSVPLSAEVYCYSNLGYGSDFNNHFDQFCSWAIGGIVVVLFLAILFKGVLFHCLRKK